MKQVDFKDVVFEKMVICGVEGLFTSLRVDKDTIPSGWNKYSVRHSDEGDEWFCTLEKFVWANHFGDFITKESIEMDSDSGCIYIDGGYDCLDDKK